MTTPFNRAPDRRDPNLLNKWTRFPPDVIPMWVADMDFRAPPPVLARLRRALENGALGYEMPSRALMEMVAGRMDRLYDWKVDPDWIVAITGIVSAFNAAARAFCQDRKRYLIQPPVYSEFHAVEANLGLRQCEAPLAQSLKGSALQYEVDWDAFERQLPKTDMFLLCNPHNPVGKVFSPRELRHMAQLCLEHDVLVVADEIHSELLLGEQSFVPLAKAAPACGRKSITLVSPSKTFNIAGLFCGFAIIPDPQLRARYKETVEKLRIHVNGLGLMAAREAFSGSCDAWLADLRAFLTANRDFLIAYVTEYLPDIRMTRPAATYLAWFDCSELVRQGRITGTPCEFFLNEARVALGEGRMFGRGSADFVRLNFGCTRRTLKQALDRLRDSLYRRKRG